MRRVLVLLLLTLSALDTPRVAGAGEAAYRVTVDLEESIRTLGTDDLFDREPAEALIDALGTKAVPALAVALEKEDDAVRLGVVEVLASIDGDGATQLLLKRAEDDPSIDVRVAAIRALIARADPEAAQVVPLALQSDDPRLYRAAFEGCGRLCPEPAQLDRIVGFALSEPAVLMGGPRAALVRATAAPGRRDSVVSAVERVAGPRLGDEDPERRARAGLLFADLEDPRSLAGLEAALDHDVHTLLRAQAILALGRLGNEKTAEKVAASLDTLPRGVSVAGCQALALMARRGVARAAAEAARVGCSAAK